MTTGIVERSDSGTSPGFFILDWDSEKFGFPVALVDAAVPLAELPVVAGRMRSAGVVLAYVSAPEVLPAMRREIVHQTGAVLADVRVNFMRQTKVHRHDMRDRRGNMFEIQPYSGEVVGPALVELARQAGEYSRFRTDPRIDSRVFEAIYDAWLIRSARREIADEMYVATFESRPVGLLTLAESMGRGTIGLLSVDRSIRGRGLGRSLVELALQWFDERGCTAAQVVTQSANLPACALYEAAGFGIASRERMYHLWLR